MIHSDLSGPIKDEIDTLLEIGWWIQVSPLANAGSGWICGIYKRGLKTGNWSTQYSKKFKTPHKIGYNKIFDTGIIEAKKVYKTFLRNKKLGKVVLIRSHRLSGRCPAPKRTYYRQFYRPITRAPLAPTIRSLEAIK